VSYLLTRYEKKQHDITKYGVDISNGDKLVYKHHTTRIQHRQTPHPPEDHHPRLATEAVSNCKWLRKMLAGTTAKWNSATGIRDC